MRRFYALSTQPTLFGEMSLIRNCGRIGTSGRAMVQTFDGRAEAIKALVRLERAKRRRGYAVMDEKPS
ncbi:WGR domain-containing protein (plasmid) [Bradyrhizobium lupini]|uniref:WGR domain-containing protein n=1 Tax=Rhizobium lupini TaxID=136996 RepID=UPI00366B2CD4